MYEEESERETFRKLLKDVLQCKKKGLNRKWLFSTKKEIFDETYERVKVVWDKWLLLFDRFVNKYGR